MGDKGGLLGSLLRLGAAYVQHTRFAQSALAGDAGKRFEALQTYVKDLSDASFSGFKVTLAMLMNSEGDARRKESLQALIHDADRARTGQPATTQSRVESRSAQPEETPQGDHDPEITLVDGWYAIKDDDRRMKAVLDHLMTLNERQYTHLAASLQTFKDVKMQMIKNHEADELNAWGTYFEDRMAYMAARERTGAKDPEWVKTHNAMTRHLAFLEWTIQACDGAWGVISKKKGK
jgi:hypothetical protein